MASSNTPPIGFSTGAVSPGEPARGIDLSLQLGLRAIELSALREHELPGVREALNHPRLEEFHYVSIHAPSRFAPENEAALVATLIKLSCERFAVVVHPDVIGNPMLWRQLGDRLLLENMDRRKAKGRYAHEFERLFAELPLAGLCFDVGHVQQVDPSMTEAMAFLRKFGERLREIHISEVASDSSHGRISMHARGLFAALFEFVPPGAPIIIESVLGECRLVDEVASVESIVLARGPAPATKSHPLPLDG